MTYEWGYTYSEPMPIAPLNWVRRVLAYAVQEIPPAKINLGIPNYAYDWTLPYVKGESRARTLGVVEAMQQAVEVGAEIFLMKQPKRLIIITGRMVRNIRFGLRMCAAWLLVFS